MRSLAMSPAQTQLRTLRDRQSPPNAAAWPTLGLAESLTDETRSELDAIEAGTPDLERQLRAATRSRWTRKSAPPRS